MKALEVEQLDKSELTSDFLEALRAEYERHEETRGDWSAEKHRAVTLLGRLLLALSPTYGEFQPVGVGGNSIVLRMRDTDLSIMRAVKVSRPLAGHESLLASLLQSETDALLRLSHPNLMPIFARGSVSLGRVHYPYFIMEYVENAKNILDYFRDVSTTTADWVRLFGEVLGALAYMHENQTVHLDLKPTNILVRGGQAYVTDLGFAKHLKTRVGSVIVGGTQGYIHPEALESITTRSNPNRWRGTIRRSKIRYAWDLYSLGKTSLELLESSRSRQAGRDRYVVQYLLLLSQRLLDGHNSENELPKSITHRTIREIAYGSAAEALRDIAKLTGAFSLSAAVPELASVPQDSIGIGLDGAVAMTDRVASLMDTPALQRMAGVTQRGLDNLAFPTVGHKRLEHLLGTYALTGRYVVSLYYDPRDCLFRQVMSNEDIEAVLVAALVHDVGHYPLIDVLAEAAPEYFDAGELLDAALKNGQSQLSRGIASAGWSVSAARVRRVLGLTEDGRSAETFRDLMLRQLLNGPISAAKVDHIRRDAHSIGLSYGEGIAVERLLRGLTMSYEARGDHTLPSIAVLEQALVAAESLAFARYGLHAHLYWHHAVRASRVMAAYMALSMLDQAGSEPRRRALAQELARYAVRGNGRSQVRGFRVDPGDWAVLSWLASHGTEASRSLLSRLSSRQLFRRIHVVSGNPLESRLYRLFDPAEPRWRARLALQQAFQRRIVSRVTRSAVAAEYKESVDRFLDEVGHMQLLLVDVPPAKPDKALHYIPDAGRLRLEVEGSRPGMVADSDAWRSLHGDFRKSIGRVRVYADRDYAPMLVGVLPRDVIESCVSEAEADARAT